MKKLPVAIVLIVAAMLIGQALQSVRRNSVTPQPNPATASKAAAPNGPSVAKNESGAVVAEGQKPLVIKRGKQAIKPEEVFEQTVGLAETESLRASNEGAIAFRGTRKQQRYTMVGRLPKFDGQDGGNTASPADMRPTERRLIRAGRTFTGDLRTLPKTKPVNRERPEREDPRHNPIMIERGTPASPPATKTPAPLSKLALAPPALMDFDGLDRENWGAGSPSDVNGDVGPTYYIQSVNSSVGIFRKSDGVREAAFTFDTLMSQGNFGNLCDNSNFGDPVVLYDTFEDRWILTDFAFQLDGGGNVSPPVAYQCFAASKTSDPVSGGWNFYSIEVTDGLNDYPKLGIWPDGLYMSANMFGFASGASFQGVRAWALNKAQMYAGSPTVQVVSFDLGTGDFTVVPSNARLQTGTPPAGTPNYFVSTWNFLNAVSVYKFHVDWNSIGNSSLTGPDSPLAATSWPNANVANAPQTGTATLLDVLQLRAMVQNQYSNIGGAESLWATHTVRRGNTTGFAAPRWYQVNVTGGTVAANLPQAATWDPDAANVMHRFMPSLGVDRQGNMALGYSTSSSSTIPAIKYAGRLASDPINTFSQTEQTLFAGLASQTGSSRWGDYSSMTLDIDGCTFWYTNQYGNTDQAFDKRWKTRINSFRFPECSQAGAGGTLAGTVTATAGGAPISGATVLLGVRSATTNGAGQYSFTNLPAGTYPVISASFPGSVTASATSIVVNDGGTTPQNFSLATAPTNACPTDTTLTDFQAGVGTNVDLTTSPGDVTLAIPQTLDQSNTTLISSGFAFTTAWHGQTFTAAQTGPVKQIDLNLFSLDCSAVTMPNITVALRATSGNLPTGADLATATIPGFCNGGGGYFTATFATPVNITAGTQYAIVWRTTLTNAASAGLPRYVSTVSGAPTGNPYAGGQGVSSTNSGSTWTARGAANNDHGFKVYLDTGFTASGNLVSSTKDSNPASGLTPVWTTLSWNAVTPANTSLQFQVAGSNSLFGPFNFVGPDGTAATFFTTSPGSLTQFNGLRYLQYKAYLASTDSAVTPTLNDVTLCYVNSVPATVAGGGTICANGSTNVTVTVNGGTPPYTVILSNSGGSQTGAGPVFTFPVSPMSDTNYTLAAGSQDANSIPLFGSGSAQVVVTPLPPTPTITPGGPTTFCEGGNVTLTSSSATGNQWYLNGNPIGGATGQMYVAAAAGNYTVVVTTNGCPSAASALTAVTINPAPPMPTITPGGPTTFCTGGSVTLTSSSASGNQWYLNGNPIGGATNQAYVATATGNYSVAVTANGCTSVPSAATPVTVNPTPPAPTITPDGPTTFCAGGSVTLTSSSASGNQWYLNGNPIGGATGQMYVATATGSYTVIATASGCASVASAVTAVTVNPPPPAPTITPGGPTTFCTGGSVTLTSSSASGNQWYLNGNPIGGATGPMYVATASGNYTVIATASGCASVPSAATPVTVNPIPPTPTITPGGPTTFCLGGNVTLTSSSASGNQWYLNGNPLGGATNQAYVATAAGSYTVIVTSSGCSSPSSSPAIVTVNPIPPTPTITPGGPTTFCAGGNVTLTSSSASGNQWFLNGNPIGGATNQAYVATATGNYSVAVTANGCASVPSAATTVTVNPTPPTPAITPNGPTTFCAGGSVTLTSSSASGNQWYLNGNPIGGATGQLYVATASGSFTVVATASGCASAPSAATPVTVNPIPPTPTITPNGPTTFCPGGNVTLTSSSATGNQWYLNGNPIAGATNPSYLATVAGNYTVSVSASGCNSVASVPTPVTISPITLNPASLPGGAVGQAYNQFITVTPAGAYTFSVSGGTLPPGVQLNIATGGLTGIPTNNGTFSFAITANSSACSGSRNYTVSIGCPGLSLTPASLPNAQAGVPYSQAITLADASGYQVVNGNLPPGLNLQAVSGALTGLITVPGTYNFSIQATTAGGCSASQAYTIVVTCPTVVLNPANATLPGGPVGTAYSQTFSATPSGNYSFTKTSGTLPPGLTLNGASGVLSGTPTTQGTSSFAVTATGFGTCTGSRTYSLTITASCATITLPALPAAGTIGVNYSGNLAATTPSASYTFTVESGTLPPGLTINNLFGQLSGKPTTAGTFNFTLKATRSNGCTGTRAYTVVVSSAGAALARLADYDGDGKSDLSLWAAGLGVWRILSSRTQEPTQQSWGLIGDLTLLGDYDGDGLSDLAVFRPSDATFYVRRSSNGGTLVKPFGLSTDVPVEGDYDGDGKTDIAVWRGSTGVWYIQRSSDGRTDSLSWGTSAAPYLDVPMPGDYDGDGKTDLAVFRRQTGTWLIKGSRDGLYTVKAWGLGSDLPVAGDYDGDGKADLAVWRGTTGQWFVLFSADQSYAVTTWGAAEAGDVPVPGDYDGDGKADLAVWRTADSSWYIKCTGSETVLIKEQGPATARPIANRLR
jgi:hypothetical protein